MGSVLTRDHRSIEADGTSKFNYNVPTLTIGGTKDGLMRISRVAESFWHAHDNITPSQKDLFPVVALEGVSHAQFMSGVPPSAVKNRDLKPDVSETDAHKMVATSMVQFVDQIIGGHSPSININASKQVVQPLLDAMTLEGNYQMKQPCYANSLVGPTNDPTCQHGSPWSHLYTQSIMGGSLPGTGMKIENDDNFHRVESINPVHLPEVDSDCAKDSENCTIKSITVSECIYEQLDKLDTGYYPVAASEIKTKISSRQRIQQHAGNQFADFHQEDEVGNRCAEINNFSI